MKLLLLLLLLLLLILKIKMVVAIHCILKFILQDVMKCGHLLKYTL